jgi:hypothetical protein
MVEVTNAQILSLFAPLPLDIGNWALDIGYSRTADFRPTTRELALYRAFRALAGWALDR